MMNDHSKYAEWLPVYVSGALDEEQRRAMSDHLRHCTTCQSDVTLWQGIAHEVVESNRDLVAPAMLVDHAIARVRQPRVSVFHRAFELVRAQVPLVRGELWFAGAAVMALGMIVATIVNDVAILRMLAPMVAAASIAVIYGPESDPALELTLATATSAWKILLARMTLVFGYNLVLALAASGGMLVLLPAETVAYLILDWLGPMTFLSAAALILALWIGTGNAIGVTYAAWLLRFLPAQEISNNLGLDNSAFAGLLQAYQQFWASPLILVLLSAVLIVAAGWRAGHQERHLPRWV